MSVLREGGLSHTPDVQFGVGGDTPLLLDILRPDPVPAAPMPVVVEIHGGGWFEGDKDAWRNEALARHGFFTASITYRLSPRAPWPAQLHDCKAAIRWLCANARAHGIDPGRIGVWGHSAGGHLAAHLGASGDVPELEGAGGSPGHSSRAHAVVDVSGPTDILDGWTPARDPAWYTVPDLTVDGVHYDRFNVPRLLFGGPIRDRVEAARTANPLAYLRPGPIPPYLIVHGERDEIVPFRQAELLRDALVGHGAAATFVPIPDGDHGLYAHWPDIERRALGFFRRHLQP